MASPLRSGTRILQQTRLQARSLTQLAASRPLYNVTNASSNLRRNAQPRPILPHVSARSRSIFERSYGKDSNATPSPPTADDLITEIQDLYETATDEFEIATDSTDGSTIYAASDRESARDALNQLCAVYDLYTGTSKESGVPETGDGPAVDTGYDPKSVEEGVRDEVRRRVGQRIRELRNAVEVLEDRAKAD